MTKFDERVDAYIEKSQPFAQPILTYLRELVHEVCPDAEEAMKWSFPHFIYRNQNLCSMASFKAHCAFGFWLESEMKTMKKLTEGKEKEAMFLFGKIKSIDDLPARNVLKECILEAMEFTEMGVKIKKKPQSSSEVEVPEVLSNLLKKNRKASEFFQNASPSFRKEYSLWIADAKTETTAHKRAEQAVEWIGEGKGRHWKYEKK